jgi:hypothetical protein
MAATAAAAVLVVGVLWPTGDGPPALAEEHQAPSASVPETPQTPAASGSPAPSAPADLVDVTAQLLNARTACQEQPACLATVMEDPGRAFGAGVIDLDAAHRTITLLDDFGGVAVLRVDGQQAPTTAQLVVIVESDGRWRMRDVHDVAPLED